MLQVQKLTSDCLLMMQHACREEKVMMSETADLSILTRGFKATPSAKSIHAQAVAVLQRALIPHSLLQNIACSTQENTAVAVHTLIVDHPQSISCNTISRTQQEIDCSHPNAQLLLQCCCRNDPLTYDAPRRNIRTSSGTFLSAADDKHGVLRFIEEKIALLTGLPASHGEVC